MGLKINSNATSVLVQVINLARRPDRLARVSSELRRSGVSFETQTAVDGQLETFESKFLSKGAIACWKSHVNSMRRIVEAKAPFGLILEDDAVMSPLVNDRFLSEMTNLMIRNQLDILQIGFIEQYYAISLRPGILEFIISLFKNRGKRDPTGFRFVLGEFRAGAHAYLVNARLADAFSKSCPEPPIIPWDDYLGNIAQGQLHRGIRIARLVKSVVSQASRSSEVMLLDSDIGG